MYRVVIVESAERELKRLDRRAAEQVSKRIEWLVANIEQINPLPLTREWAGFFKLRVGDYRVIYKIDRAEQVIIIHQIGHRREVYRER